uniref:Transferase hexapeptide repeat containing protein n=1 Tax=mine drainage metagenome TaxID=410659 RepID=E6Q719_9ZZZZ
MRSSLKHDLIIWGASGHAKVLSEFVEQCDFRIVALFDQRKGLNSPLPGIPVYQGEEGFATWLRERGEPAAFAVAIGGGHGRDRIAIHELLTGAGLFAPALRHPTAFIAADAVIGAGSQILAQAAVCASVRVGNQCIINTAASVDHECRLGNGVHVAPGAHLAGLVTVEDFAFIGIGATVLPRIRIGKGSVVGAGAVVTRDVPDGVTVLGVPARQSVIPPKQLLT